MRELLELSTFNPIINGGTHQTLKKIVLKNPNGGTELFHRTCLTTALAELQRKVTVFRTLCDTGLINTSCLTLFQDHLELFFGSIRMALGANNNPSSQQFVSIFKKLLTKLEIRSARGNCQSLDKTTLLTVSSSNPAPTVQAPTEELGFINSNVETDLDDKDLVNNGMNFVIK